MQRHAFAGALIALSLLGAPAFAQPPGDAIPPSVVTHVDAEYPPSALERRAHGDVVLFVTVDVDGHVSKVETSSSDASDFEEAAKIAVRQWTFVAAQKNGKPVASRIRVPFHFAPPAPPPEIVAPPKSDTPELSTKTAVPAGKAAPAPAAATPPVAIPVPGVPLPDEVRVHGRSAPPPIGASEFRVNIGELAKVPHANASELLKVAAPGLMLTNEGGEGHAEQVFLRGFDAREGQDVEFTVGGVPINESGNLHGNGYADTHFIIPELVQSLRVVEGPFDPRQGNYAVAGSADYQLGLEKRGITAKYTGGSFNSHRMLLTWGPQNESRHTFGGAEIASTDGFGQNRAAQRASAMGQYEGRFGDEGSWRLTAQGYSTHYHSAGVVREDDYKSGKMGFYDSYDVSSFARQQTPEGGDASRYSAAGDIETRAGDTLLSQQVFFVKRDMRLLENFTGFLLDVQTPLQSTHLQRGDMLDLSVSETTFGARGAARFHGTALKEKQELELGYFARGDWVTGTQQRVEATTGVPYATENNLDSKLGDIGLYGDASLRATPWLSFRGGARGDLFTFDVNDNCAVHDVAHPSRTSPPVDQSCLDQQDFGRHRETNTRASTSSVAFLPRGSLIVGPFEGFTFNASYGQGVRSIDPSYITNDVKTPFASIQAYEGGAGYLGEARDLTIVVRSIFFQTHVDRDLIFSETAGRNILGVGTTRTGWVGAARVTGAHFDEGVNLTLVRSAYDDTNLLVAYVPDVVFRSDTAVFENLPPQLMIKGERIRGTLGAGITYVGPRALPYGQRSNDLFTLDASATLTWTQFEVGFLMTNVTGNQYRSGEFNYASDFHSQSQPTLVPERHFTAGAPRAVFGTFAINFGGS